MLEVAARIVGAQRSNLVVSGRKTALRPCTTGAATPGFSHRQRGSVRFEGSKKLRYEVSLPPSSSGIAEGWGLIWTHGLTSSMRSEDEGGWPFASVVDLADTVPVTRYDARGHGTSDSSEIGHTWRLMGEDIGRLRQAWRMRHTVLGGTSMGAAASLYAVLEAGVDAAGLILATPPTCHERRQDFLPMYRESLDFTRSKGLVAAHDAAAKKMRPPIFLESEVGAAMFEIGWNEKYAMGLERYCAAMEGACDSDLPSPEVFHKIDVPTLILAWRSDVQHPVETAEMLCSSIPNAELFVASSWAEVEEFPERMRQFIRKLIKSS